MQCSLAIHAEPRSMELGQLHWFLLGEFNSQSSPCILQSHPTYRVIPSFSHPPYRPASASSASSTPTSASPSPKAAHSPNWISCSSVASARGSSTRLTWMSLTRLLTTTCYKITRISWILRRRSFEIGGVSGVSVGKG